MGNRGLFCLNYEGVGFTSVSEQLFFKSAPTCLQWPLVVEPVQPFQCSASKQFEDDYENAECSISCFMNCGILPRNLVEWNTLKELTVL